MAFQLNSEAIIGIILGATSIGTGFGLAITKFKNKEDKAWDGNDRRAHDDNVIATFTKGEHDELCDLKMKAIISRLSSGDETFNKMHAKLDALKDQIVELTYSKQPWDGKTERRKRDK